MNSLQEGSSSQRSDLISTTDAKGIMLSRTPYPEVNEILTVLLGDVKEILREQFVGMYLFGSLANGDFDEHSDIDVLIVTAADISNGLFMRLEKMHKQIASINSPWAIQLEVSYIPRVALQRFDAANNVHPHLDRGKGETLHWMTHAEDWIVQRHMMREHGIVLTGPELTTMIDPISPNELRQAVIDVLPLWANPILEVPSRINKRGYQSFFVLSLCRMLYTLQKGDIVSKLVAAEWAKANLSKKWTGLIERAWTGRQTSNLNAQSEDISETLGLIRHVLEYSAQINSNKNQVQNSEFVQH